MRFPPAISLPARGSGELTPALACLALAAMLALQLAMPQRTDLSDAPGRAPRLLRDPSAAPIGDYAAISRAPIFAPSRSAAGGASGEATGCGSFEALGVGLGGGAATAVLRTPGGAVVRARPGQTIEGWRVAAVTGNRVVLSRGGERAVLTVGETSDKEVERRISALGNDEDPEENPQ
ncbi:MAG TPA: hypothetical protein VF559_02840 [Caulobacteraceae bacterium]